MDITSLPQPATNDDQPRPVATSDDQETYSLTVKQAAELYAAAGFPRIFRVIQRHCKNGDLASVKHLSMFGYEYRISRTSVERHIAQLAQVHAERDTAANRGQSRLVATEDAAETPNDLRLRPPAASDDQSRPVATSDAAKLSDDGEPRTAATTDDRSRLAATETGDTRYLEQLERDNEFLRGQVSVKDGQITVLQDTVKQIIERDKETNVLMQGFQHLFSSMLGVPQGKNVEARDAADRRESVEG